MDQEAAWVAGSTLHNPAPLAHNQTVMGLITDFNYSNVVYLRVTTEMRQVNIGTRLQGHMSKVSFWKFNRLSAGFRGSSAGGGDNVLDFISKNSS